MVNLDVIIINIYLKNKFYKERVELVEDFLINTVARHSDCTIILGGDFNSRIGLRNQLNEEKVEGSNFMAVRNTKGNVINSNDVFLTDALEAAGLVVLSSRSKSDATGELIYFGGVGQTTIDFIRSDANSLLNLEYFEVVNLGLSDHLLIKVTLKQINPNLIDQDNNNNTAALKYIWDDEKFEDYIKELQSLPCSSSDDRTIEEVSQRLSRAITGIAKKLGIVHQIQPRKNERQDSPWFDREYKEGKKLIHRLYRVYQKDSCDVRKREFTLAKTSFAKLVRTKKKEHSETIQKELSGAKDMRTFLRLVNKYKKKQFKACPIEIER